MHFQSLYQWELGPWVSVSSVPELSLSCASLKVAHRCAGSSRSSGIHVTWPLRLSAIVE